MEIGFLDLNQKIKQTDGNLFFIVFWIHLYWHDYRYRSLWIDEPQLSERLFGQKKNKKKQKLKYSWALESPIAFCLKILELFFSFATKI